MIIKTELVHNLTNHIYMDIFLSNYANYQYPFVMIVIPIIQFAYKPFHKQFHRGD